MTFDIRKRTITCFDSLHGTHQDTANTLIQWMDLNVTPNDSTEWKILYERSHRKQWNGVDCGVHLLIHLHDTLPGYKMRSDTDLVIKEARIMIGCDIIRGVLGELRNITDIPRYIYTDRGNNKLLSFALKLTKKNPTKTKPEKKGIANKSDDELKLQHFSRSFNNSFAIHS